MRARRLSFGVLVIVQVAVATYSVAGHTSEYCGTRQWRDLIEDAARRFNLSPAWPEAILHGESAGCASSNGLPTVSAAGAMGLMQLMPTTWERLQSELHLGQDPFDPRDNILAGVAYLRELYDRFGLVGAIAAYHSGPARYQQHLRTGRALPDSTLEYVSRVLALIKAQPIPDSPFVESESGSRSLLLHHEGTQTDPKPSARTSTNVTEPQRSEKLFVDLKYTARQSNKRP
jgi:soluble lytic murein transglycosylase-like protein